LCGEVAELVVRPHVDALGEIAAAVGDVGRRVDEAAHRPGDPQRQQQRDDQRQADAGQAGEDEAFLLGQTGAVLHHHQRAELGLLGARIAGHPLAVVVPLLLVVVHHVDQVGAVLHLLPPRRRDRLASSLQLASGKTDASTVPALTSDRRSWSFSISSDCRLKARSGARWARP
jgi:hypothetical protein